MRSSPRSLRGLALFAPQVAVPRELLGGQPSATPLPLPGEDDEPVQYEPQHFGLISGTAKPVVQEV